MARTYLRPVRQIGDSDTYVDTLAPGSALETTGPDQQFDLNAVRSMLKRIIHGADVGNWYDDPATIFGADASLKALLAIISNAYQIVSESAKFSVPSTVTVNELVYLTGAFSADRADNSSVATAPVIGIVVAKPSATTATVAYFGTILGFTGLTPKASQFLGSSGGLIEPPLPTTPGTVVQKVGQALDSTTLMLDPDQLIIL